MTTALQVAQDRIATDGSHADQLAKDLDAAKKRLKKLEASIKAAAAQRTVTVVKTTSSSSSSGSSTSHHGDDDHEGPGDD
jgi:ABC-type Zn uptake system ZnuABC Zn-binding protein ZnuA